MLIILELTSSQRKVWKEHVRGLTKKQIATKLNKHLSSVTRTINNIKKDQKAKYEQLKMLSTLK